VLAALALLVVGGAAAVAVFRTSPTAGDAAGSASPAASGPTATPPAGGTSSTSTGAEPSSGPVEAGLALRRTVTVRGSSVTVVERLSATSSQAVVVAPRPRSDDPGLVPLSLRQVAQDGTASAFDAPVTLPAGGNLRLRGSYRLRYCPDLVPATWPTTFRVTSRGVPVEVVRSDEPLNNARAICPGVPPSARAEPALRVASWDPGRAVARLRLAWRGSQRATLEAVGAPSGFPLDAAGRRCGPACVSLLVPGRRVVLQLRPVDGCPSRSQASDGLPLLVAPVGRGRAPEVVSVTVRGLGRWFSSACR
jgi:hypothetical protein